MRGVLDEVEMFEKRVIRRVVKWKEMKLLVLDLRKGSK